jgi:hypothetical protein
MYCDHWIEFLGSFQEYGAHSWHRAFRNKILADYAIIKPSAMVAETIPLVFMLSVNDFIY